MIFHYFKMALRNQAKSKLFSFINILGLAVGITATLLIVNYVSFEFNFDNIHTKKDRIYRVESKFYEGNNLTDDWATSSFGYASAMKQNLPGIEKFVRVSINNSEQVVSYQDKKIRENTVTFTEPSFFEIFDFKLKEGDAKEQLVKPRTVVISETAAKKFFKNEEPLGKILKFAVGGMTMPCEITGILKDMPKNSHIHFDYLISYVTLPDWMKEFWYLHEAYSYVLLEEGINPGTIEDGFPAMAEKYKTHEALKEKTWAVELVPLADIHLNPQKQYEKEVKGNGKSLITLLIIAAVILITAWINYINLTTARSMERAREVGIRKVSGAFKLQLIRQYLIESWLVNLLSIVFAAILVLVLNPVFSNLIGKSIGFFILKEPLFWMTTIAVLLAGIVLSGLYPAFVLSSVKTATILKGNHLNSSSAGYVRRGLVIFQFTASLFLICGTFVVYRQVKFMQEQDLGVNIDQTVVLKYPVGQRELNQKVKLFVENLELLPQVKAATVAGSVPGMEVATFASNKRFGDANNQSRLYEMLTVDYNFIETFDLKLAEGRSFKKGFGDDINNMLVNESSLALLGFKSSEEAIGKKVLLEGQQEPVTIIGVVKNWHQRGLNNAYTPIMFLMNGRVGWISSRYIALKTNGDAQAVVNLIQTRWNSYFPESSFDFFFLDHFYNLQYMNDKRFGTIFSIFTGLALFISILGLWALAAFTVSKKVKEVGVRKVLGAETGNILYLFSKEILILVLVAFAIATPVSVIVMKNWLLNYPFRTNINFWIYLTGGGMTVIIALTTIAWQSWKVAVRNPVESLRYE